MNKHSFHLLLGKATGSEHLVKYFARRLKRGAPITPIEAPDLIEEAATQVWKASMQDRTTFRLTSEQSREFDTGVEEALDVLRDTTRV